jgi:hypothetical protein
VAARALWKEYFVSVNCIVFMVDANDRPRFHESKLELDVRRCLPCVACCMADVDMPYVAHPTKLRCTVCAAARLIERLPSLPSTSYQCAADIYTDRIRYSGVWSAQQLLAMEDLQNVPFLILGNKVDIGTAANEAELRDCLGLTHLCTGTHPSEQLFFFFASQRITPVALASLKHRRSRPQPNLGATEYTRRHDLHSACACLNLSHRLVRMRGDAGKGASKTPKTEQRPIEIFMCSVVKRFGYSDGTCSCHPARPTRWC